MSLQDEQEEAKKGWVWKRESRNRSLAEKRCNVMLEGEGMGGKGDRREPGYANSGNRTKQWGAIP